MFTALKTGSWQLEDFSVVYLTKGNDVNVPKNDSLKMLDAGWIEKKPEVIAEEKESKPTTKNKELKPVTKNKKV